MSSMWDRFEVKTVLGFTGMKERLPPLFAELSRVGMKGYGVRMSVPNPFDRIVLKHYPNRIVSMGGPAAERRKIGWINSGLNHYFAVKTAYEMGAGNILVMEDDIRFLTDLDRLAEGIADLPEDYDVALLDHFRCYTPKMADGTKIRDAGSYYAGMEKDVVGAKGMWFRYEKQFSLGCYSMSRTGMERFIGCFEGLNGEVFRVADHYTYGKRMGEGLNKYAAKPLLAVQFPFSVSNSGISAATYSSQGVDLEDYGG